MKDFVAAPSKLKFLFQFFFLLSSAKHTLYLCECDSCLQIFGRIPLYAKARHGRRYPQFAQIVRRDHRVNSRFVIPTQTGSLLHDITGSRSSRSHREADISLPRHTADDYPELFSYLWKKLQFCDFRVRIDCSIVHEKTWFETRISSGKSAPVPFAV